MLPVQLNAQQNDPEPPEEITVIGVRGSLLRSIESKYADQGFSDAIAAEDLGKFPDLNVALLAFRANNTDGGNLNCATATARPTPGATETASRTT